jgi:hypothetical protein
MTRPKKLVRPRGRPELPDAAKRKVRINVFVTEAEYEQLAKDAEKAGCALPDYIRTRLGL